MSKIRIAQIGTSRYSHGNFIFDALKKSPDIFEIAGYAMPEGEETKFPENMAAFQGFPRLTVEEICKDPGIQAVAVETEECFLTKYALLAARAGKHIHMEKPGSDDVEAFDTLIDTVKANRTVFHTGYMYRYNPFVQDLMARIRQGELGEILGVEAQMNTLHPPELRRWLGMYPGGSMFFLGCHLIDLILQIQGLPERILPLNKSTGLDGVIAEDFCMAVLEYPRGVSFAKVNSTEVGGFARRQLVVAGSLKTVELKPFEVILGADQRTTRTEFTQQGQFSEETPLYNHYAPMMRAFGEMVQGKRENPWPYEYERTLYHTVLQCCNLL